MININLSIRQNEEDEAGSYMLKLSNPNGFWCCDVSNEETPGNVYSIKKESFEELCDEIENYIKTLGVVIHVHLIEVPKEIKDILLGLKDRISGIGANI